MEWLLDRVIFRIPGLMEGARKGLSRARSGSAPIGDFDFNRDREKLFQAAPSNTFLVKVNYWLGR